MRIETLAIHAANHPDPSTGAVAPSIHLSTTFARDAKGELISNFNYTRGNNPNRAVLEAAAAQLEGGTSAFAYASGIAAIFAVFQTLAPGDHLVVPTDVYHGTRDLLTQLEDWGYGVSYVDMDNLNAVAAAIRPETRLIFIETPSNPMLRITDIKAVVNLAKTVHARVAVDNTWATPVLQRPFDHGADYSVHSSTKYFGGHSDVLGGILVCREDNAETERMREQQWITGAVPAPFDSWLVRRGLMTLPLRVRAQTETAMKIAQFLEKHPRIEKVHYPGLRLHPGHVVAARQMNGFGAMMSVQISGGEAAAASLVSKVELFVRATSLGSVESLIEHRYQAEGLHSKTPKNLLRLSIGLEHPEDLINDLNQALGD